MDGIVDRVTDHWCKSGFKATAVAFLFLFVMLGCEGDTTRVRVTHTCPADTVVVVVPPDSLHQDYGRACRACHNKDGSLKDGKGGAAAKAVKDSGEPLLMGKPLGRISPRPLSITYGNWKRTEYGNIVTYTVTDYETGIKLRRWSQVPAHVLAAFDSIIAEGPPKVKVGGSKDKRERE